MNKLLLLSTNKSTPRAGPKISIIHSETLNTENNSNRKEKTIEIHFFYFYCMF